MTELAKINLMRTALFHTVAALEKGGFDDVALAKERDDIVARLNELGDDGAAMLEKFTRVHAGTATTKAIKRKGKKRK